MTAGSLLGFFKPCLKYGVSYFLILIAMPNWNYNQVDITASEAMVREWLIEDDGQFYFNMHKLFPERFEATDLAGHV